VATVAASVGAALYLLGGVLYLGSGLVMPYPWAFGMGLLWATGWGVVFRVYRRAALWTPAVAVGAVVLWVGIVSLGEWAFGWTA
jgi:hypothetical protein